MKLIKQIRFGQEFSLFHFGKWKHNTDTVYFYRIIYEYPYLKNNSYQSPSFEDRDEMMEHLKEKLSEFMYQEKKNEK